MDSFKVLTYLIEGRYVFKSKNKVDFTKVDDKFGETIVNTVNKIAYNSDINCNRVKDAKAVKS